MCFFPPQFRDDAQVAIVHKHSYLAILKYESIKCEAPFHIIIINCGDFGRFENNFLKMAKIRHRKKQPGEKLILLFFLCQVFLALKKVAMVVVTNRTWNLQCSTKPRKFYSVFVVVVVVVVAVQCRGESRENCSFSAFFRFLFVFLGFPPSRLLQR